MQTHGVTIRQLQTLRGHNLYAYMPVLKITLDIGPYEEQPSNSFPGFVERLIGWLPGLQKHECSLKRPGGFIERLHRGTYLAHICEHITLELQGLMGFNVTFGRARGTGERGVYTVVIEYKEELPAQAAFDTALRLTLAAMHNEPFDVQAEVERLLELADEYRLGPSTAAIVAAARACNIPILRIKPKSSLVQLGYGVYQKRILASETSHTSAIAVDLCQEKPLTNHILRQVGVPVPAGGVVDSADEAWVMAQEVGLPVVVKPADGNQGKGVSVNLNSEAEVRQAYAITVTRLIAHMYETARWVVGMTCTDGIYINKELVIKGDCSGPKSARTVLLHPQVEVAVLETARGGILREGLAFDECTVSVVTNLAPDHLGIDGVETLDNLAQVKQVVVEAVSRDGAAVLNAEDRLVAEMAAATDAQTIYFSADPDNHILRAHLADEDGRGVFVEDGMIVLAEGERRIELVELARIPFTYGGKIGFQVQNALAATAAAWAAGLNPAMIVRALTTFETDTQSAPGRFNVMNMNGVEVILDYGHNPAALEALGQAVMALPPKQTVMSLTLPGDRRNEDIIASTTATISYIDAYVVYDSEDRRGRAVNEVAELICRHIPADLPCEVVVGQRAGILRAWQLVKPGDRLLVICDSVSEALMILNDLAQCLQKDGACTSPVMTDVEEHPHREPAGFPALTGVAG